MVFVLGLGVPEGTVRSGSGTGISAITVTGRSRGGFGIGIGIGGAGGALRGTGMGMGVGMGTGMGTSSRLEHSKVKGKVPLQVQGVWTESMRHLWESESESVPMRGQEPQVAGGAGAAGDRAKQGRDLSR